MNLCKILYLLLALLMTSFITSCRCDEERKNSEREGSSSGDVPETPDTHARTRRNRVRKNDQSNNPKAWTNTLSEEDLELIIPPQTIQSLVLGVRNRAKDVPIEDVPINFNHSEMNQCLSNYQTYWTNTESLIPKLNALKCWDVEQLAKISEWQKNVKTILKNNNKETQQKLEDILEPYLQIQNMVSYCRTKNILEPLSNYAQSLDQDDFSDKILLHMVGDIFGRQSGLEGLSDAEHLRVRHRLIESLRSKLKAHSFIATDFQANPCKDLKSVPQQKGVAPYPDIPSATLDELFDHSRIAVEVTEALYNSDFAIFERKFRENTQLLKKDGYFYFQAGWLKHAVVVEVRRDSDSKYSFRVYNSGEGLQYHFGVILSSKTVYFPFIEKIEVTLNSMMSKGFVKTLFDLKKVESQANNSEDQHLYTAVTHLLDGTLSTRKPSIDDFLDPQISGTCAYYSTPYYSKARNNDHAFSDFVDFHLQFKYIDEYFLINEKRLKLFVLPYNLAKRALVFFSESIASASRKTHKYMDSGMELFAEKRLSAYHTQLTLAFESIVKTVEKVLAEASVLLAKNTKTPSFNKPNFNLPEAIKSRTHVPSTVLKSMQDWQPKDTTIKKEFNEIIEEFLKVIHKPSYFGVDQTSVLKAMQEVALKLPLDHGFWDRISEEDLRVLLFDLRRLSEFYLWSIYDHIAYSQKEERGITPTEYLVQLKNLTVADQILQALKVKAKARVEIEKKSSLSSGAEVIDPAYFSVSSLYLDSMREYLAGEKINFAIHDASWNYEFNKISEYWKKSTNSFFTFGTCLDAFETKSDFKLSQSRKDRTCNKTAIPDNYGPDLDLAAKYYDSLEKSPKLKIPLAIDNMFSNPRGEFVHKERRFTPARYERGIYMPESNITISSFYIGVRNLWFHSTYAKKLLETVKTEQAWTFLNSQQAWNILSSIGKDKHVSVNYPYSVYSSHTNPDRDLPRFIDWDPTTRLAISLNMLKETKLKHYVVGEEFYHLRTIAFIADYLKNGYFDKESAQKFRNRHWQFTQKEDAEHDNSINEYVGLDNFNNASRIFSPPVNFNCKLDEKTGWECKYSLFNFELKDFKGSITLDEAMAYTEPTLDELKESVVENINRLRQPTNKLVITNQKNRDITFDEFRQLRYISGDPASQISQTIGYFSENYYLLLNSESEYRSLFKKLTMDPGLFITEALHNNELSHDVGQFCKERFKAAKDSGDILFASYFLRLNQYFYEHLKEAKDKRKASLNFDENDFMNSRQELISLIEKSDDDLVKNILFRDLIRTYLFDTEFAHDDDLSWLLIAHIYRNIHPQRKFYEKDLENDIFGLLTQKQTMIEEHLKKSPQALTKVLHYFPAGHNAKGTWTGTHPLYHLEDGSLNVASFDTVAAKLFIAGSELISVPVDVLHNTYFQEIAGKNPTEGISLGNFYEFVIEKDSNFIRYRVSLEYNNVLIRRKWGDRWYQHLKNEVIEGVTFNKETEKRDETSLELFPGYSHWIETSEVADNKGSYQIVNTEAFFEQKEHQKNNQEILIFKEIQDDIAMVASLETKNIPTGFGRPVKQELEVKSVTKIIREKLSDYILFPISEKDSQFSLLTRFEDPRYVFIWKDGISDTLIELSRLNLQFTFNPLTNKIMSKEYGQLSSKVEPTLRHIKNYLRFENGDGVKILAARFQTNNGQGSLDTSKLEPVFKGRNVKLATENELNYFVYNVHPDTKELKAFGTESKIFLIYLYLCNAEYSRALSLLKELKSHVNLFSNRDLEVLLWLIKSSNNFDPAAVSIRLGAMALYFENTNHFHRDQEMIDDFLKNFENNDPTQHKYEFLVSLYKLYLQQRFSLNNNDPEYSWFFEEDEIWLFYENKLDLTSVLELDFRYKELLGKPAISQVIAHSLSDLGTKSYSYLYPNNFFRDSTKSSRVESVLKGGSVLSFIEDFYEIARDIEDPYVRVKIVDLFRKMSLGYVGDSTSAQVDFISYLDAVRLSSDSSKDVEVAQFLLTIIEAKEGSQRKYKNLPSLQQIRDIGNLDANNIHNWSTDRQKYFDNLDIIREFWQVFPTYYQPKEVPIPSIALELSEEDVQAKKPIALAKRINRNNQESVNFGTIDVAANVGMYMLEKPFLSKDKLKFIIQEDALNQAQRDKITAEAAQLKRVFSLENAAHTNELGISLSNDLEKLQKKIDVRTKELSQTPHYSTQKFKIRKFIKDLEQEALAQDLQGVLNDYRTNILEIAHTLPKNWFDKAKRKLEIFAHLKQETSFETLLRFFATQNREGIFDSNDTLNADDVNKMLSLIKSFLIVSTFKNKRNEIIKLAKKIADSDWSANPELEQAELQNFVFSVSQQRSYDLNQHPDFLVFEFFMGFLIREEQKKAIDTLNLKQSLKNNPNAKGAVYELIMGSGKTSVLLPLISYFNMDSKSLSVVIFPENLLPSMSQQINEQMLHVFGRKVEVFDIKRNHNYDETGIQSIKDRFEEALQQNKLVIMSNSSVQSLFLLYIQSIKDPSQANQTRIYREIFNFLREHAFVTIDEVDSVLDIMKSHRFSIGKPVAFNRDAFFATMGLYHLIVTDEGIRNKMALPFLMNKNQGQATIFNPKFYETQVKAMIISKLIDKANLASIFYHNETQETEILYKDLDPQMLRKFFESTDDSFNQNYLESIKDQFLRGFLATLYTQIHLVLPLSWSKLYKIHYGLHPWLPECGKKRWCPIFSAIPFQAGRPLIDSRFGSDLESLNYALQSHLEEKNALLLLKEELKRLQETYSRSSRSRQIILMKQVEVFFPALSESKFITMKDDDVVPYVDRINQDPDLLMKLLVSPLRKHVAVFNHQISTNALIYPMLFKKIQGVTGTLWNLRTMAPFYDKVEESNTVEETLTLLWAKSNRSKGPKDRLVSVLKLDDGASLDEKIGILLDNKRPASSVIDQGGLFRGFKNEEVAKRILNNAASKNSKYHSIIFYDSDHFQKIYSLDGSVKDYHESVIDRDATLAYWDLQHTTGSDLKIDELGIAVMVVNKNVILRDLLQSAWRLRGLHRGQLVDFAIPSGDLEFMQNHLSEPDTFARKVDLFKTGDLFFYAYVKELEALNDQTYRSIHLGMNHELIQSVIQYTLTRNLTTDAYQSLYKHTKSLFEVIFPFYSYTVYGHPFVIKTKEQAMLDEKNFILDSNIVDTLDSTVIVKADLELKLKNLEEKGVKELPLTVLAQSRTFDNEIEVETELEMEVEQEITTEQDVKQQVELVDMASNLVEHNVWPWRRDELFKGHYHEQPLEVTQLKTPFDPDSHTLLSPIARLNVALSVKGRADIAPHFDNDLFISMNAAPVYTPAIAAHFKKFEFFSAYQKEFNDVLVVVDEQGHCESVTIIDREEARDLGEFLFTSISATSLHTKGFLLYNLGGQFYRYDYNVAEKVKKNPDFLSALKSSDKFMALITQVRFLSGRSNFDNQDIKVIQDWFDTLGGNQLEMINLFEFDILQIREKQRQEFNSSMLKGFFTEQKKHISKSKYFDLLNDLRTGEDIEKKDAQEKLTSKIKENDEAAIEETQNVIMKIFHLPLASESLIGNCLKLMKTLVEQNKSIENAAFVVLDFILDHRVSDEIETLGDTLFRTTEGKNAMLSNLKTAVFANHKDFTKLTHKVSKLLARFGDVLMAESDWVEKMLDIFLVEAIDQEKTLDVIQNKDLSSSLGIFLAKIYAHEPSLQILMKKLKNWQVKAPERALTVEILLARSVNSLSDAVLSHLTTEASRSVQHVDNVMVQGGMVLLFELVKNENKIAFEEALKLIDLVPDDAIKDKIIKSVHPVIKDFLKDPTLGVKADLFQLSMQWVEKLLDNGKELDYVFDLIQVHFDTTSVAKLQPYFLNLGRKFFSLEKGRQILLTYLKDHQLDTHRSRLLKRMKAFFEVYAIEILENKEFQKEFLDQFIEYELGVLEPLKISQTTDFSILLEALLKNRCFADFMKTKLLDWEQNNVDRALMLHLRWLKSDGQVLFAQSLNFAKAIESYKVIGAMKILCVLIELKHVGAETLAQDILNKTSSLPGDVENIRDQLQSLLSAIKVGP